MNIQEFRQKYPDYNDMPDQQLADSFYHKYYSDMPKEQFMQSFIGKPEAIVPTEKPVKNYKAKEVPLEAAAHVIPSSYKLIKGIGTASVSPVKTGVGIANLLSGATVKAASKILPVPQERLQDEDVKTFDAFMNSYVDKYGGWENIKRAVAEDPAGVAADLTMFLGGTGTALKSAGTTTKISGLAKAGEIATKAASITDPINAIKKVGSLSAKAVAVPLKAAVGLTTGKGQDTIQAIYNASKQGGEAKQALISGLRSKSGMAETVQNLRDSFQALKDKRAAEYGEKLTEIEKTSGGLNFDTAPIQNTINDIGKRFRIKQINYSPKEGWSFEGATTLTPADKKAFGEMLDIISEWKNKPEGNTAIGLDSLKQQLDNFYTQNSRIGAVATGLKKSVRDILEKGVPGYKDMTAEYGKASTMLDELNSAISIGKKANTQTVVQKVGTTMREDSTFRRDLIKTMDELTGKNLVPQMAGAVSNAWLPTGLVGRSMGAGELAAIATGNFMPGLLPLMAAGSPRLMGEVTGLLGSGAKVSRQVSPYFNKNLLPLYPFGIEGENP